MSESIADYAQGSAAMYYGESGLWSFGFPSLENNSSRGGRLSYSQPEMQSFVPFSKPQVMLHSLELARKSYETMERGCCYYPDMIHDCLSCQVALNNLDLTLQLDERIPKIEIKGKRPLAKNKGEKDNKNLSVTPS